MRSILIVGGGGHARSVIDVIERMGEFDIAGIADVDPDARYKQYEVIGNDGDLRAIRGAGVECAALGLGYMGRSHIRDELCSKLEVAGFDLPAIVDPSAAIAYDATMGPGAFVGKCAVVNSAAKIGKMAIVNSGAVVEHDCNIGDFSHISVNATLCGNVGIGKRVFVGAGATIVQGTFLGEESLVGAGAIVLTNVKPGCTVVGIHHGQD